MSILSWLRPKRRVIFEHRLPSTLTAEEWRSQPVLVSAAAKVMSDPTFREMMDILRTSCYVNYQMGAGTPIEERAFMQTRGEGYLSCLNDLLSLGEPSQPKSRLEPTFEEEEIEIETTTP